MPNGLDLVIRQGGSLHSIPLGGKMAIGRAPDNDLSLLDETVSWHHAVIWVERGEVWIRDLRSRNGTFINDERLWEQAQLRDGDEIRLGANSRMQLRGQPRTLDLPPAFYLEDITNGLRFPLHPGTLPLDSALASDMGISQRGELVLGMDGGVKLVIQGSDVPIALGEPFTLNDRQFRVVRAESAPVGTVGVEPYPYRLEIRLDGPRGAEAVLTDRRNWKTYRVTAENRALLLYLLARKRQEDLESGMAQDQAGWCDHHDLIVGIWGKGGVRSESALPVLVHRLRKELEAAEFDPGFLEKEPRILRIRLMDIVLQ